jgi:hypothetical protein
MFKLVQVVNTDYELSEDRNELQNLADELNRDAIDNQVSERWIVVQNQIWESLQITGRQS